MSSRASLQIVGKTVSRATDDRSVGISRGDGDHDPAVRSINLSICSKLIGGKIYWQEGDSVVSLDGKDHNQMLLICHDSGRIPS